MLIVASILPNCRTEPTVAAALGAVNIETLRAAIPATRRDQSLTSFGMLSVIRPLRENQFHDRKPMTSQCKHPSSRL